MRWRFVALGVALVGAVFFAQQLTGTSAASPTGAMALDCDGETAGIQTSCTYDSDARFSVQVHVTKAPAQGYFGVQARLRWNDPPIDYLPTDTPEEEALWPECGIAARNEDPEPDRPSPDQQSVLHGCVPFPLLDDGDLYTGAAIELRFACQEVGYTTMALVAGVPAGSYFIDSGFNPIEPTLTDVEIGCGMDPPTPTPCPPVGCPTSTPTPTATPTFTPRPTSTPCPPDSCDDTLIDGPLPDGPIPSGPSAPGMAETPSPVVTPSPLAKTPLLTDVAGAEVSALPQTGLRPANSAGSPWSKLAIALAAVATLAAGVGALRLRGRGRS